MFVSRDRMTAAPTPRRRSTSPALASRAELRGAHVPKQLRSVESLQRVVAAARDVLAGHPYETVSVAQIARAAGVSVGALYTRFPSKEHLVVYLLGDVADDVLERLDRELAPSRWTGTALDDIVRFYVREMAASFTKHRWILRPATIIARQVRDPELIALLQETNRRIHGAFRALVLGRLVEIAHPEPAVAIDVAILMVSAAMREVFLYGEPVSRLAPAHQRLVDELSTAAVLYLKASAP